MIAPKTTCPDRFTTGLPPLTAAMTNPISQQLGKAPATTA